MELCFCFHMQPTGGLLEYRNGTYKYCFYTLYFNIVILRRIAFFGENEYLYRDAMTFFALEYIFFH